MNILSIISQKPNSTGSGVYLSGLLGAFDKLGHSQAVIFGTVAGESVIFPEEVVSYPVFYESTTLPFPILGMSDEMPYPSTRYSEMTEEMFVQFKNAFTKVLNNAVAEFKPDLILCHHLYMLTAIVRENVGNIPVYGICHNSDLRQISKNTFKKEWIIHNIRKLDGIFALHSANKITISNIYSYHEDKIYVIGAGYNNEIFFRKPGLNAAEKREFLRIIYAGKLARSKGVNSLIKAVSLIPKDKLNLELILCGGCTDTDEMQEIKELSLQCEQKIIFKGRISQSELSEEMNNSDIFVIPSFYEGIPLVLIEALACGLPAICTDLPGIRDMIQRHHLEKSVCFVKPPRLHIDEADESDLSSFEAELSEAIQNAEKLRKPDEQLVSEISWNAVATRLLGFINRDL